MNENRKENLFDKLIGLSTNVVERYLPEPFVFAAILTPIVLVSGIVFTHQGPITMINHWYSGFWSLHTFAMQMILVVVTGHTLALSPVFNRGLKFMASLPKTNTQGIMIVTFVAACACWINWGFGLVIGAIYAREIAKKVPNIDYRLLVAAAYSGFLVWHSGLSGSIPLKIATQGEDLTRLSGGVFLEPVPITETLLAPFNIVPALLLILTLPILNALMHPKGDKIVTISPKLLEEDSKKEEELAPRTPAEKMDSSVIVSMTIGAMGLVYIVNYFYTKGFSLNLNIVIFTFLILGIITHKTPKRLLTAVRQAVKSSTGIIIQFPLYAGIMGMMQGLNADGLSVASLLTELFVYVSNSYTLPFFSFLAAGALNFFVPSGGGHWVIQGPIFMPAAVALDASTAKTAMGIAWGDAWTNMLQPFWALPALGIAGLGARNIMGFCLISMLYSGVIISLALFFL